MRGAAPSGISRNPAHWRGCEDVARIGGAVDTLRTGARAEPCDLWLDWIIPTYNQTGPSCVGHAWSNWVESMVRRNVSRTAIPRGHQIDGDAVWRRGIDLFQGGDETSGLTLEEGFRALVSLAWLPLDAQEIYVPSDWDSCSRELRLYPMVQGHAIHEGWFHPSAESGCIDHGYAPDGRGGHATLLVGTTRHEDRAAMQREWRVSLNSWGADYGRGGLFVMTDAEWLEGAHLTGPMAAHIPDFRTWRGWEKGLIKTPERAA